MRKSLLLIAFLVAGMLHAQTPNALIGGEIIAGGKTVTGETMISASAGLTSGVFAHKNILLGLRGTGKWTNVSTFTTLGPMLRFYGFIGSNHALYIGGDVRYGWGSDHSLFSGNEWPRDAWIFGARTGYLSRFNKYVALDAFLFFDEWRNASQRPDGSWSERAISSEFGIGLGIQIFL